MYNRDLIVIFDFNEKLKRKRRSNRSSLQRREFSSIKEEPCVTDYMFV